MNMPPEPRHPRALPLLMLMPWLLAACGTLSPHTEPCVVPAPAPATAPASVPGTAVAEPWPALADLLHYHQGLRAFNASELSKEMMLLSAQPKDAALSIRKAMVLSLLPRNGGNDLALAQLHLDAAVAATDPQADALRPLARLLAAQMAEQRRLNEHLDRLGQQVKDSQRRNEQLAEKLEALKTIERTLPAASTPLAPAPGTAGKQGG